MRWRQYAQPQPLGVEPQPRRHQRLMIVTTNRLDSVASRVDRTDNESMHNDDDRAYTKRDGNAGRYAQHQIHSRKFIHINCIHYSVSLFSTLSKK